VAIAPSPAAANVIVTITISTIRLNSLQLIVVTSLDPGTLNVHYWLALYYKAYAAWRRK
jgi:hypothetical protein